MQICRDNGCPRIIKSMDITAISRYCKKTKKSYNVQFKGLFSILALIILRSTFYGHIYHPMRYVFINCGQQSYGKVMFSVMCACRRGWRSLYRVLAMYPSVQDSSPGVVSFTNPPVISGPGPENKGPPSLTLGKEMELCWLLPLTFEPSADMHLSPFIFSPDRNIFN